MAEFRDFDCFPCASWRADEEFNWGEIVQHGGAVYVCAVTRTTSEPGASDHWRRIGLLEHYPTTARRLRGARRALGVVPRRIKLTVVPFIG